MAGEISMVTGVVVDALPSPVAASLNRSGSRRPVSPPGASGASETKIAHPINGAEDAKDDTLQDKKVVGAGLERVREALLAQEATLTFERDTEDGRMYMYVRDKHTGEEIYRIPKNYMKNIAPQLWQRHQVDVRI